MPTLEKLADFWSSEGLKHIIPNIGNEFPEGFDVRELLKAIIKPEDGVLEVGCGYGRLCRAFPAATYTGVDVNPSAIAQAKERNPEYRFEAIAPAAALPQAGTALLYTVALHISDEELVRFLKPICEAARVVVIAELMDVRWRRGGDPPVFNRDPEQYVATMMSLGYLLQAWVKAPYARYSQQSGNVADGRITFHTYRRQEDGR